MKEKSHKGQRHKGCCGMCAIDKRAGNNPARRPATDRRKLQEPIMMGDLA